jgi:excisionase family DNA binding protein
MSTQRKMPVEAAGFDVEGLKGLSENASRFIRRHPKEARIAVAAALEAAAVQHEAERDTPTDEVPEALKPFVVQRQLGADTIGVSETAARLKVSRTTVYEWIEKKILLGWKSTKRGVTIPAEQILGPGKVVPGISEVLAIIDDPELAWEFLSGKWPFAGKMARPIDKLKAGDIDDVSDAAPSFGTAFT